MGILRSGPEEQRATDDISGVDLPMISIPIPCCSCSCSCCLIIVIVVVGFAEVVIVRIRSHAGKRGEAEAWMMDQSQHESWDDIAII